MMVKRLALVMLVFAMATSARAELWALDDPAQGSHPFLLTSAARTVTLQTASVSTFGGRTCVFVLNVTAGAALSIQAVPQFFDPGTAAWLDIMTVTAVTTTGAYVYIVGPGSSITGSVANASQIMCPSPIRMKIYHNNANSATYTLTGFAY